MYLELKAGGGAPKPPIPKSECEITKNWKSKDSQPLVSILCHCFNHEEYLEDALNGFLMQKTDFPWEVLLHDDASTDKSIEIIQRYVSLYPRIIKPIFQKENQYSKGLKPSFFTTKVAQGKFFAFCEGDDYWLDENKLQIQADFLNENPSYSVCGHDAFTVENEQVVKLSKLPERLKKDVNGELLAKGWFVLTLTAMFRRDYDIFPEEQRKTLNGDTFMFSRLGKVGKYKFMKELLPGAYRVHSGGIWSLVDRRQKTAHSLNSMYWISQYYKRIGDDKLSVYYAQRSALLALEGTHGMSIKELVFFNYQLVKRLARRKLNGLYSLLKKI